MTQPALSSIHYIGRINPFHRSQGVRPLIMPAAVILLMILAMVVLIWEAEDKQQLVIDLGLPMGGLLLLGLGTWLGGIYVARRVSLTLDDNGIRFENSLPLASLIKPSWFLPWSELERVEYKGNLKPEAKKPWLRQIRLHPLRSHRGKMRRLDPTRWVDSNQNRPDFGLRMKDLRYSLSTAGAMQARYRMALDSHLVEDLGARGWPALDTESAQADTRPGYTDEGRFDLMQHRGLKALTFAALALLTYFVIDTFLLSPWRYADGPPIFLFVLTGLVFALAAAGLGKGAPRLERLGVTLLFGVAVGAASWPAALRVNATDGQPETVTYQSVAPGEFEPVSGDYPLLTFEGFEDYWQHPEQRADHDFELHRGPLGFWQLNHNRVVGEMREFFTSKDD